MASQVADGPSDGDCYTIAIKNPSRPGLGPFTVKMPRNATIHDVKVKLSAEYHGNPSPSQQTLIHGGRILKEDGGSLSSIFSQVEQSVHTLHLVVKGEVRVPSNNTPPIRPPTEPQQQEAATSSSPQPEAGTSTSHQAANDAARAAETRASQAQSSAQSQQPFVQAGFSGVWPASQPDPTILAAYNAALESLRSRPPFPSFSSGPASMAQAGPSLGFLPHGSGYMTPQFVPPFSAPPTVAFPPPPGSNTSQPASTQATASDPASAPSGPSEGGSASRQLPANAPPTSRPAQLFAPTLAYVPVSLVQGSQSAPQQPAAGSSSSNAESSGARQQFQPQGHQMLPYPPYAAPLMPMMMPFGFNPYAGYGPHMMPQMPNPATAPPPFAYRHHQHAGGHHAAPPHPPAGGPPAAAAAAHPADQPAGRLGRPGMPAVRVRLIRINIKLLAQIAIIGFLMYQSMPRSRFFSILGVAAAVFFLWPIVNRNNAVAQTIARLTNFRNPRVDVARGAQPGRGQRGFLQEAQALILGFFASLLPGFNVNAEDAAAFAAAQQVVDQNEGRPHMD